MKRKIFTLVCLSLLVMQGRFLPAAFAQTENKPVKTQVAVTVNNDLLANRPSETISINWKELVAQLPFAKPDYIIVKDTSTGANIPSQTVDYNNDGNPEELIFQADFAAREASRVFVIEDSKNRVPVPESKTFGRYVPERFDDFAWENDRIAFRMYGKALEQQMVSSGIDIWAKRTRAFIIDTWFKGGDAFYHKDNGTGLDFYSVKKSRGCGGSGIWDGKTLHVSRNYRDFRVLANGPIRTVFELIYEPWEVNGARVSEVKRITLDAGQNLNKVESVYKVDGNLPDFKIGVGIARHEPEWTGTSDFKKENGWMSRWENTKADGSYGCAVVTEPAQISSMFDEQTVTADFPHQMMILSGVANNPVKYYFGAGWDKSGDFADKKAWNTYLDSVAQRLQSRLKVSFLNSIPGESVSPNLQTRL